MSDQFINFFLVKFVYVFILNLIFPHIDFLQSFRTSDSDKQIIEPMFDTVNPI